MHKEVSEGSSETEQKDTETYDDTGVWLGTGTGFSCGLSFGLRPKTNPSTVHFQYPAHYTGSDIRAR